MILLSLKLDPCFLILEIPDSSHLEREERRRYSGILLHPDSLTIITTYKQTIVKFQSTLTSSLLYITSFSYFPLCDGVCHSIVYICVCTQSTGMCLIKQNGEGPCKGAIGEQSPYSAVSSLREMDDTWGQ